MSSKAEAKPKKRRFDKAFKFRIVEEMMREGRTLVEIAKKYNADPGGVSRWRTQYNLEKARLDQHNSFQSINIQSQEPPIHSGSISSDREQELLATIGQLSMEISKLRAIVNNEGGVGNVKKKQSTHSTEKRPG